MSSLLRSGERNLRAGGVAATRDDYGSVRRTYDPAGDAATEFPPARADDNQPRATIVSELGDAFLRRALKDLGLGTDAGARGGTECPIEDSTGPLHFRRQSALEDGCSEEAQRSATDVHERETGVQLGSKPDSSINCLSTCRRAIDGGDDRSRARQVGSTVVNWHWRAGGKSSHRRPPSVVSVFVRLPRE
jgi:hypothetical protein